MRIKLFIQSVILLSVLTILKCASYPKGIQYSQINHTEVTWMKTYGSPADDEAFSVQHTINGGYVFVGYTESKGTKTPGILKGIPVIRDLSEATKKSYKEDLWIMKVDKQGEKIWEKIIDELGTDFGYSVLQTDDGGFIIAGQTGHINSTTGDLWLIKLDSLGNKLWDYKYDEKYSDGALCVKNTIDGGFILSGWTGVTNQTSSGDALLIKTDKKGIKLWSKVFGTENADAIHHVQQTSDGGYILVGITGSVFNNTADVWIIKTDSDGNKLWERKYGSKDRADYATSVLQTYDKGYMIVGVFGARLLGIGGDAWLIKTDDEGNVIWDKKFGSEDGGSSSIFPTSDKGYLIGGWTRSHPTLKAKRYDGWLIKIDEDGNKKWDQLFGGGKNDFIVSIQQAYDDIYVLAGRTNSDGAGRYDAWLIEVRYVK